MNKHVKIKIKIRQVEVTIRGDVNREWWVIAAVIEITFPSYLSVRIHAYPLSIIPFSSLLYSALVFSFFLQSFPFPSLFFPSLPFPFLPFSFIPLYSFPLSTLRIYFLFFSFRLISFLHFSSLLVTSLDFSFPLFLPFSSLCLPSFSTPSSFTLPIDACIYSFECHWPFLISQLEHLLWLPE